MSYIGANDLVFNNNKVDGIFGGGFSVNSIMMKNGMSPIMTLNGQKGISMESNSDSTNNGSSLESTCFPNPINHTFLHSRKCVDLEQTY